MTDSMPMLGRVLGEFWYSMLLIPVIAVKLFVIHLHQLRMDFGNWKKHWPRLYPLTIVVTIVGMAATVYALLLVLEGNVAAISLLLILWLLGSAIRTLLVIPPE